MKYKIRFSVVIASLLACLFVQSASAADKKAADFSLVNWDGKRLSLKDFKGKRIVLTFSYAFCSATCPIVTGRLFFLDNEMDSPKDLVYVHISMDPEMDSTLVRKDYFNRHTIDLGKDKRWVFLSEKRDILDKVWKSYGISAEKITDKKLPEGYYMRFTPKVLVIDREGNIKMETDFNFSEDKVKEALRNL